MKANNQRIYKHVPYLVVISAIENNKSVSGDSRERRLFQDGPVMPENLSKVTLSGNPNE